MDDKGIYPVGSNLSPERGLDRNSDVTAREKSDKEKKLRKACADFESLLIYQMVKTMRKTVPDSGLLNKISGKDTYEMIMDQKLAEELAGKGGLGIQKVLFNQLTKNVNLKPQNY
ncbi:MAG TPA: rod-binding protein [Syntrophales bacterium]|nr:rod-binding protein [Syntrophales bacterium]